MTGMSGYAGTYPDQMKVVQVVLSSMNKPPFLLDITLLSAMRKDAHPSIYSGDLTAEQRANPDHSADCSHWCLPGLPDTWNQLFYTALFYLHQHSFLVNYLLIYTPQFYSFDIMVFRFQREAAKNTSSLVYQCLHLRGSRSIKNTTQQECSVTNQVISFIYAKKQSSLLKFMCYLFEVEQTLRNTKQFSSLVLFFPFLFF